MRSLSYLSNYLNSKLLSLLSLAITAEIEATNVVTSWPPERRRLQCWLLVPIWSGRGSVISPCKLSIQSLNQKFTWWFNGKFAHCVYVNCLSVNLFCILVVHLLPDIFPAHNTPFRLYCTLHHPQILYCVYHYLCTIRHSMKDRPYTLVNI